jgi:hypothetical protein
MSDACYTADTSIAREKLLCLVVNKEALNNAAGRAVYTLLIAQELETLRHIAPRVLEAIEVHVDRLNGGQRGTKLKS